MSNSAVNLLRAQIEGAHQSLEGTLADVSNEQAQRAVGGAVNPIGAQYVHILTSEDGIVNGLLKGAAPLFASEFAGKAGFNAPPPGPSEDNPGLPNWNEWASSVQVDMDALRQYAQAVYAATDAHLATLSDEELAKNIPTALGEMPVSALLTGGVLANFNMHCGEISALKGLQGNKGYPF